MLSILEQAIQKYSGGDIAYQNKLKEHIRNGLGYSNYMSRLGQETSAPASIGDIKGLSPQGIRERMSSRFGMQNQNVNTLQNIAGAFDTAAGNIANEQIAHSKAGGSTTGFDNGIAFRPTNPLQQDILAYMQKPKNPNGTMKSLQQFESEMNAKWAQNRDPNVTSMYAYDSNSIKNEIQSKIPNDFIGQEDKYSLMSQGYSAKQAKALQGALNYDTMSEPEKLIFETQNPTIAKSLQEGKMSKELIQDIGTTTDPKTGQTVPKYTFDQLVEKYPNIPAADIKSIITPVERNSLMDDVTQWLSDKKDAVKVMIDPSYKDDKGNMGYSAFMSDPKYKQLKDKLSLEYGSVFSDRELDQLIYNTIYSQ